MFKKLTIRCVKTLWAVFATAVVLLAVLVSLLKFSLPYADKYRSEIESYLLTRFNAEVSIGSIAASWQTSGPAIVLENLRLTPSQSAPLDLSVKETRIEVDFWNSLKEQKLVTGAFLLDGIRAKLDSQVFLKVRPESRGSQLFENLSHLFLSQIQQFKVVDSFIIVNHKDGRVQDYQIDNLSWVNEGNRHRGQGELYVDGFSNNSLEMIVDLYGQRRDNIFGQLYLEASKMDVSPWLTQLIGEHVELDSTEASFQVWGGIKNGLIDRLLLDVTDSGVHWKLANDIRFLKVEQAKVQWQKQNDDWLLYSQQVQLKTKDDYPEKFDFSVFKNDEASQVQFKGVDVKALSELFSLFNVTKSSELLTQSNIEGRLDNVDLYFPADGQPMALFSASSVNFLPPQQPQKGYLGVENVSLKGFWQERQGWFELAGEDGSFVTLDTFSAPFDYNEFNLFAEVQILPDGLAVRVPQLELTNDDIEVKLAAEYSSLQQSFLGIYGEIKGPKQGSINQYLPKHVLPPDTYAYLDNAIQMGRGELTQLAIFGDPSKMPYSDLNRSSEHGTFFVSAEIKDALFRFDQDWPAIEEMDANLTVENSTMVISAHSGRLAQLDIDHDVVATIPLDVKRPHLDLKLRPQQLQLTTFHDLVNGSPLDGVLGEVFDFVKLEGVAKADVTIDIPLDMSPDEFGVEPQVVASGRVTTESAKLSLPRLLLDFEQVASTVEFENEKFSVNAMDAQLFQLPINFTVGGQQQADGYKIDGTVNADWSQPQIVQHYDWPALQYFSGDLSTALKLSVNIDSEGYQYFVAGQADLLNTEYKVSGPVEKNKGTAGNLDIFVSGDQIDNQIDVTLNEHLYFKGIVPNETAVMEAAHLAIGSDDFQLPDLGFDISLDLPYLEFEPTLAFVVDLIKSLPEGSDDTQEPFMSSPFAINGTVQSLSILGQKWDNVSLDAEPKMNDELPHWLFSVGAQQALTEVKVFNDLDTLGIDVQAEFMQLSSGPELQQAKQQDITTVAVEGEQASVVDPASFESVLTDSASLIASLPPITAVCLECSFDEKPG